MKRLGMALGTGLMALAGCEEVIDLDPIDSRAAVEADVRPRPISGGTLVVASDGTAVAADPDRDVVYLVDVADRRLRHTVALQPGDEPGRVVEGTERRVHVVLRGFGGMATVDRAQGTVLARRWLCPDPRGMAHDSSVGELVVACADGTLLRLDEATGAERSRTMLEPDLRDVVVVDGSAIVSRFRSAELLGEDGGRLKVLADDFESHVAWRTITPGDTGRIAMLHQLASVRSVPIGPDPDDLSRNEDLPYGGGGGFCEPGIVTTALTIVEPTGTVGTTLIPDARLAVDFAMAPGTDWVALAMPGSKESGTSVGLMFHPSEGCFLGQDINTGTAQVTAVAFASADTLVMQSREPARLLVHSGLPQGDTDTIPLSGDSRFDTGHEIFHRTTDSGLSCATCHPEGGDDGHVWSFVGLGDRRTQPLDIGIGDTAPFHWDGDMGDLDVLMGEVLAHRMGGSRQSEERSESFARWVFAQRRPPADAGLDEPALVRAGQELFASLDCVRCHTGPDLGGTMTTPIRGKELQVPSLRRVSLRPPFMHDGRSATIEAAVRDMIVSTTSSDLDEDDVAALSAYMRTL